MRRGRATTTTGAVLAGLLLLAVPAAGAAAPPRVAPFPKVRLAQVATAQQPAGVVPRAGDPNLYVIERLGRVRAITPTGADAGVVVDLMAETARGVEEGLLGLAFTPDGSKAYVHFVDKAKASHIVEFGITGTGGIVRADPASRREVLTVPGKDRGHHYGGLLQVTPDGLLWIGVGDGNGDGDKLGRAQDLATVMGKILRIDPRATAGAAYSVPKGNPFVGRKGARPEVWAYGLRNPWRGSFDVASRTLWVGDVGEGKWEEIDRARGGENFGWPLVEGTHRLRGAAPRGSTMPVHEYGHASGGCAVIAGHVYRGAALPRLQGLFVFADLCTGRLSVLVDAAGRFTAVDLGVRTPAVTSLGTDLAGEVHVTSLNGGVFKLVPA